METDLLITGKVAEFGRGLLAEISSTLLGQFVENLESTVLHNVSAGRGPEPGAAVPDTSARHDVAVEPPLAEYDGATKSRVVSAGEGRSADPVDVIALARGAIARRFVPAFGSVAAFLTLVAIVRRISPRGSPNVDCRSHVTGDHEHASQSKSEAPGEYAESEAMSSGAMPSGSRGSTSDRAMARSWR